MWRASRRQRQGSRQACRCSAAGALLTTVQDIPVHAERSMQLTWLGVVTMASLPSSFTTSHAQLRRQGARGAAVRRGPSSSVARNASSQP